MLDAHQREFPNVARPVPARRYDNNRRAGVAKSVRLLAARTLVLFHLVPHPLLRARLVLTFYRHSLEHRSVAPLTGDRALKSGPSRVVGTSSSWSALRCHPRGSGVARIDYETVEKGIRTPCGLICGGERKVKVVMDARPRGDRVGREPGRAVEVQAERRLIDFHSDQVSDLLFAFGASKALSELLEGAFELVVEDVVGPEHGRLQVVGCRAQDRVLYQGQQPCLRLLEIVIVKAVAHDTELLFEEFEQNDIGCLLSHVQGLGGTFEGLYDPKVVEYLYLAQFRT